MATAHQAITVNLGPSVIEKIQRGLQGIHWGGAYVPKQPEPAPTPKSQTDPGQQTCPLCGSPVLQVLATTVECSLWTCRNYPNRLKLPRPPEPETTEIEPLDVIDMDTWTP